jgi:hypothetical protein
MLLSKGYLPSPTTTGLGLSPHPPDSEQLSSQWAPGELTSEISFNFNETTTGLLQLIGALAYTATVSSSLSLRTMTTGGVISRLNGHN